jgi:hypothetical protein
MVLSCSNKRSNYTTLDADGKKVMTQESRDILLGILDEFVACRNSSTQGMMDCKHFTARLLCEFYQIDDFQVGNSYVNYEEMLDIIYGKFNTWEMLGMANDQDALNKAQDKANNGQAVVAISRKSKYGHVVVVVPGSCSRAPSWGNLEVPLCASLFLVAGLEPFIDKPMAYAWSSPADIVLYCKTD